MTNGDPRVALRHMILGELARPTSTWDIAGTTDRIITWLLDHGWRPPDVIPHWRDTPRRPLPEVDVHDYADQARAAIREAREDDPD